MEVRKRKIQKKRIGRPRKIDERGERRMVNTIKTLRKSNGNFTAKDVLQAMGLSCNDISLSTVRKTMNRLGYKFLPARKKGVLSEEDQRDRLRFARKIKNDYGCNIWTKDVCFYLDGVSFHHKYNPYEQARVPSGRVWRKKSEGLTRGCTAKGSHVGSGGRVVKLMVAISYDRGIVLCEEYEHLNGPMFAMFIKKHFKKTFQKCNKGKSRLFVQDGDPSQNSAAAKKALLSVKAKILSIPPRSPDLNPIENLFHIVKRILVNEAFNKKITHENMLEFTARIKRAFLSVDTSVIDKIIGSMYKRINEIIQNRGQRLKY